MSRYAVRPVFRGPVFRGPVFRGPVFRGLAGMVILLLISGCQSLSGSRGAAIDIDEAMPGPVAQAEYAHVIAAMETLEVALGSGQNAWQDVPFDADLISHLQADQIPAGITPVDIVQRLAGQFLIAKGPYTLVQADTLTGRLEYRSRHTGSHLSVTVRAPEPGNAAESRGFYVTGMVSQVSLVSLVAAWPEELATRDAQGSASIHPFAFRRVAHLDIRNDTDMLAYLNALPRVEREREDLMSLRAMLMIRLDQDSKALALVEQGIVRYPHTPVYFTLARVMFERAGVSGKTVPASLSNVMQARFTAREIRENRGVIKRFLSVDNHF